MIIPKHTVCDFCGKPVGYNLRYYIIKSKAEYYGSAGGFRDNRKHHVCENCIGKIVKAIEELEDD